MVKKGQMWGQRIEIEGQPIGMEEQKLNIDLFLICFRYWIYLLDITAFEKLKLTHNRMADSVAHNRLPISRNIWIDKLYYRQHYTYKFTISLVSI